jgi:NADH:ubiquinone oxidoreductase subunit C
MREDGASPFDSVEQGPGASESLSSTSGVAGRDDPGGHPSVTALQAHFVDVTAVDYGGGRPIQIVYQLWSVGHKRALRVKCELPLDGLAVDSVVPLWKAANWLEREVFDLFGVDFKGHPDLRRILMPQNYAEGYPLRKDFPLRGRFSRAEQTRRALAQNYHDYYTPEELEIGGAPAGGAPGIEPTPTPASASEPEAG